MKLKRFSHLLFMWLVAICVSSLSFLRIYDTFPSASEIIFGHLVYGALALPFSFLHSVTFQGVEVLRMFGLSFVLLFSMYWIILFGSQMFYINKGGKLLLFFISIIILISSFRWLYYALAMSGI